MSCHVCSENLSEAEFKSHRLINLMKDIRLNDIESGAWLLLAACSKITKGIKNKKWSKKMWKTVVFGRKKWTYFQSWRGRCRGRCYNVQEIRTIIGKGKMGQDSPSEASGRQNCRCIWKEWGKCLNRPHYNRGSLFYQNHLRTCFPRFSCAGSPR